MNPSKEKVLVATQAWIEKAVIGLNLCPFAQGVFSKKQIRFVVSEAESVESLLSEMKVEFQALIKADPKTIDTTLVIHPNVLPVFSDFNEFLGVLDHVLTDLNLEGQLQIASFHPFYQFSGTEPDDIENYTNRSPFPILQILRETSIERGLESFKNPDKIFEANIATLKRLGHPGWKKIMDGEN